ncbi:MAG: DSD1 family PLP-dependent enzyme, partial [Proteobacteria bacterium]|nr:DSD1 family PLP-dependent enzyme [Pseudomonadota bacterium]
ALRVANAKNLNFRGLQAYHGSAQHIRDAAERKAAIDGVVARVEGTLDLLGREGLAAADVTGAGTGSFIYEGTSGVYTEVQCGSYIFMDNDYAENKQDDGRPFISFQHSLFALVSAISVAKPGHVVVDAGHKALGNDQGMPRVLDLPGAVYARPSDEHGTITLAQANPRVGLGQKLRLIPGHCDPTVNLHDWLVVVQHGVVVDLWEITARGAMR